ncbi:uncharacterized protein KRP23_5808 [Phytophthora ramorum]|uniref:uncharacterized protein n=1 Tax=Phytophthora ramorum TaxID=164328 RepID=UPI0030ACAC70|nr:hypothetical protein KRP23_5808 [Phytophthora ramorum]
MMLGVRGVGRWAGGWLWLRIRSEGDHVLLERCLRCGGEWKEGLEVDLQGQTNEGTSIRFELWEGESRATELLQFLTGWSVDLAKWSKFEAQQRWYEIKNCREERQGKLKLDMDGREYCENEVEVQCSATYLYVAFAGVEDLPEKKSEPPPDAATSVMEKDSAHKKPFQFVLPRRSLRGGKLRAIRVGQIVHEVRTDILYDLLPLTLYGRANTGRTSSNSVKNSSDGIAKALGLLQLSCQYAKYCVHELNRYSSKLESRQFKYVEKLNRLKHRQNLLDEQKANLRREAEVLSCSLDGIQSLLRELDPETLDQLQSASNNQKLKKEIYR